MDFRVPAEFAKNLEEYSRFLSQRLTPLMAGWYAERVIPRDFFAELAARGWLGFDAVDGGFREQPALQQAMLLEHLGTISPGVGVSVLVQISLGAKGVVLFGNEEQKSSLIPRAARGEILLCLGNSEPLAGSDVARLASRAEKVAGGWVLNGTKSYVTNGYISDMALITAVSHPDAPQNSRISMFLVDLSSEGVTRSKLHKEVWIPSDLTRIQMKNVFVPDGKLLGSPGRGLQQVLEIFSNSRITISALTLGTAEGAFRLGLDHAAKRHVFGKRVIDFQAKSFEAAELFSRIEAARAVLWKTCWEKDEGLDFRLGASVSKYLAVDLARAVGAWAADLFGAASVVFEHPVHKFPMDAWASSLGEGTQDVQKLIIYREMMKRHGLHPAG
ncbi:MAG: acyl-CoA/acyl-ACP dehydrogenase [Desulfobacteraceae bacterium]|nr:acyl-CoA/acyl-ACP dehydrogenase [Desulfobacteraceae bacterium]